MLQTDEISNLKLAEESLKILIPVTEACPLLKFRIPVDSSAGNRARKVTISLSSEWLSKTKREFKRLQLLNPVSLELWEITPLEAMGVAIMGLDQTREV